MAGIHDTLKEVWGLYEEVLKLHQEVLACHGKAQESIERIRDMRRGCEQEHERLCTLLSDSYNHFSRITYVGSVMAWLAVFLGGFMGDEPVRLGQHRA